MPLLLRLLTAATGSLRSRRIAAYSGIVGSLITRYAWMHTGSVSAKNYRLPLEIPGEKVRASLKGAEKQIREAREERVA